MNVKNNRVQFPTFEIIGPRCKNVKCDGILIFTHNRENKKTYYKCNVCRTITPLIK